MQGQGPRDGGGFRAPPSPVMGPAPAPQPPHAQPGAPGYAAPPHAAGIPPRAPQGPPLGVPHLPPSLGYYDARPHVPTDGKAVASIALAAASYVTCLGALAGFPALILGIVSLRDIAKSQGALGGRGLAISGIALGSISSLLTVGYLAFMISMPFSRPSIPPTPPMVPYPTATAYAPLITRDYVGSVEVHRATGANLSEILVEESSSATLQGKTLIVQTVGTNLCPRSCPEVRRAIRDWPLQDLLSRRAVLLEVAVDKYERDLGKLGVPTFSGPMFFLVESTGTVRDLISADEWADNVARNIAPVLESFIDGTLTSRIVPNPRTPPPTPTASSKPPEDDVPLEPPIKKKATKT